MMLLPCFRPHEAIFVMNFPPESLASRRGASDFE